MNNPLPPSEQTTHSTRSATIGRFVSVAIALFVMIEFIWVSLHT
jgi:hypothetical protein